jgi:capsular exopolysaccharide synthesis family protein
MNKGSVNKRNNDELDLNHLFSEILSKWHYFLITGVILAALTFVYVYVNLPIYQSTSSILIDDSKSSNNFEDFLTSDLFGSNTSIATEIGKITSRTVIQNTIDKLGLRVEYYNTSVYPNRPIYPYPPFTIEVNKINQFIQDQSFSVTIIDKNHLRIDAEYKGGDLPSFEYSKICALGENIKLKKDSLTYFDFVVNPSDTISLPDAGLTFSFRVRNLNKLTNDIIGNLTAEPMEKDANIIVLTYKDVLPLRAIDVLNTLGKVYIELDVESKATVAALTLKFVEDQLNNTGDSLNISEEELQSFKEKNKTVDLSEESKAMVIKLSDLDVQRVKSNIDISSLRSLYSYVSTNQDLSTMAPSSIGIPDPLLVELLTNYQTLQAKRKSSAFGVKSNAPALKIIDQQILETKNSILENIKSIQDRLLITKSSIDQQIAGVESQIKQAPELERDYIGIQRNVEVNQNIYTFLLQKKAETSIAKATAVSDNRILDKASLGEKPVSPNKMLLVALLLIFTLLIPGAYILGKSLFKSTIQNRDDVVKLTSVPVLGVVGHSDDKSNLVVNNRPKSPIAEAFRTIRTNMQYYGLGEGGSKVLTITSSVGGEGKSFVTLNLATIIAMQGKRVLMIGLDLRKPKLFDDLDIKNSFGASNYLSGTASLEDVIKPTKVNGLDFITAGPIPPNPAELLSKKNLQDMIEKAKSLYDFVVIDTPPLGVVADALLIMPYSDVNLYIVRQGYSRIEFLKSLNELYEEGKFKNLSIILNDSDFSNTYGYGYGHNYGYISGNEDYYGDPETKKWSLKNLFKK